MKDEKVRDAPAGLELSASLEVSGNRITAEKPGTHVVTVTNRSLNRFTLKAKGACETDKISYEWGSARSSEYQFENVCVIGVRPGQGGKATKSDRVPVVTLGRSDDESVRTDFSYGIGGWESETEAVYIAVKTG